MIYYDTKIKAGHTSLYFIVILYSAESKSKLY